LEILIQDFWHVDREITSLNTVIQVTVTGRNLVKIVAKENNQTVQESCVHWDIREVQWSAILLIWYFLWNLVYPIFCIIYSSLYCGM